MYCSIIVTLFIGSLTWAASPKEVTKIYADFEAKKNALLKSDLNKKNIKEKFTDTYKALEKSLEEVKAIESKTKDDLLTPEGNQMAYDLEALAPVKDLALGLMSKEDCTKARHEHSLNFPVVEDEVSKSIESILRKVCD